jgi:protein SCO1/2
MVSQVPTAEFSLTDQFGRRVDQSTYRGRYLLVYFGFTHCKVVCPRSLSKLSSVLARLGDAASTVTPLYITVDPARDIPEVMRSYLEQSYPRFTGLTGTEAEIEAAKQSFRVFAERKSDDEDPDGYVVPHTAIAYLMSPDGAYLAHFTDAAAEDTVVQQMSAHLQRVSS